MIQKKRNVKNRFVLLREKLYTKINEDPNYADAN